MAEDPGGYQFQTPGGKAGLVLSAINIGSGLISGLLRKRDQRKVDEANRRSAAFSNLIRSFGVQHQPVFEQYSPGRATSILSGISQAAGGGVQAIDIYQRQQERDRKRKEDERKQALALGSARGAEITRTSPPPMETPPMGIETPPQESWEQRIEETEIPSNIKPQHHELYRQGALEATVRYDENQRSIRSQQLAEAYQRENLRLGQMSLQQRVDAANQLKEARDQKLLADDKKVENWVANIRASPEDGANFFEMVEPGYAAAVMTKLREIAGEENIAVKEFLKERWTPAQETKFENLVIWKEKLVLYEDMVRYLEKEGVLGVIKYGEVGGIDENGKEWHWSVENLAERLPTSEYAPTFEALSALRNDLVNAYHRASVPGVMTEGDYAREAPMIPNPEAFFVQNELGEKFGVLHEVHAASEASYLARLNISNVYTGNIAQHLADAAVRPDDEEKARLARIWGSIKQMPGEVTPHSEFQQSIDPMPGLERGPPLVNPAVELYPAAQAEIRSMYGGGVDSAMAGPNIADRPSIYEQENLDDQDLPPGVGSTSLMKLPGGPSKSFSIEGLKLDPNRTSTAPTGSNLFPNIKAGTLKTDALSDADNRIALEQSLKMMGFRDNHIRTMQLDDIVRAFQSQRGRALGTMGQRGGDPFAPKPENQYQPSSYQPYSTPMGRSYGFAR